MVTRPKSKEWALINRLQARVMFIFGAIKQWGYSHQIDTGLEVTCW